MTYNPNQPRVPAGKETGGQWTSDGSGAASAAKKGAGLTKKLRYNYKAYDSRKWNHYDEEVEDYLEAGDYFSDNAQDLYDQAHYESQQGGAKLNVLIDESNDQLPLSFYSGDWYPGFDAYTKGHEDEEWAKHADEVFQVLYLGSCVPGGGTAALMAACKQALKGNATMLILGAAEEAIGFYEKIGMHPLSSVMDSGFYWTAAEMKALVDEYFSREVDG
jgi:hypothetical protein